MADKTLSTPQRSKGPFHACPGAGRATGSWWPAGSLASVQPNAISAPSPALSWRLCGRRRGSEVCVTHVDMYTHTNTGAAVFTINHVGAG